MLLKLLKVVSLLVLLNYICFINNIAMATAPQEYCEIHKSSGAPGTCTPCGDCVVLTTNLGTQETKKCAEGGCELTESTNCPEFPACVE